MKWIWDYWRDCWSRSPRIEADLSILANWFISTPARSYNLSATLRIYLARIVRLCTIWDSCRVAWLWWVSRFRTRPSTPASCRWECDRRVSLREIPLRRSRRRSAGDLCAAGARWTAAQRAKDSRNSSSSNSLWISNAHRRVAVAPWCRNPRRSAAFAWSPRRVSRASWRQSHRSFSRTPKSSLDSFSNSCRSKLELLWCSP